MIVSHERNVDLYILFSKSVLSFLQEVNVTEWAVIVILGCVISFGAACGSLFSTLDDCIINGQQPRRSRTPELAKEFDDVQEFDLDFEIKLL